MIVFENVNVSRRGKALVRAERLVCDAGQCSVIVGPSGGGKSSLLMALSGIGAAAGLEVGGKVAFPDGSRRPIGTLARPVCSLVGQTAALYDDLTVQQNLDIVSATRKGPLEIDEVLLLRLLEGIDPSAMPNSLSGGQRQRVAIVRSLLGGARICLMDEPDAGLDPRRSKDLSRLIADLCSAGIHVVVATHHPQPFLKQAARCYCLSGGVLSEVPAATGDMEAELRQLSDRPEAADPPSREASVAVLRRNWTWRFFAGDIWGHLLSPTALLYVGTACALIAFTLGFVSVTRYPFSPLLLDITIERITAELGDGFYRFIVPLVVGVLIAARSGSLATMDLLQKQISGSTIALRQLQVPIRRYRSVGLIAALSLSAVLLCLVAVIVSLYMLGFAVSLATAIPLPIVMSFAVHDIFAVGAVPVSWEWVIGKMALSGAAVALVALLMGSRVVRSGQDIQNFGAFAVLLSVILVIGLQTGLSLLELRT